MADLDAKEQTSTNSMKLSNGGDKLEFDISKLRKELEHIKAGKEVVSIVKKEEKKKKAKAAKKPEREDRIHDENNTGDDAVPVLEDDATFHLWKQRAEGKRPVGYGQSGSRTGDRRAGGNQNEGGPRHEHGKSMEPDVVRLDHGGRPSLPSGRASS